MIPERMAAVQLAGHGGIDRLVCREDVVVPLPGPDEVLVKVTATARNKTDRKLREGLSPVGRNEDVASLEVGSSPTRTFPRIQGADVVGCVAAVGAGVPSERLGERGLLDFNICPDARRQITLVPDYYGHGRDGGFAGDVAVPGDRFHAVANPDPADAELAALGIGRIAIAPDSEGDGHGRRFAI